MGNADLTPEEKNNLRFPGIKKFLDSWKEAAPSAKVTHARNLKTGESVGKPWTEWMTEDGQQWVEWKIAKPLDKAPKLRDDTVTSKKRGVK